MGGIGDSQNYALAWWFGGDTETGDFNLDGSVDAADYVMWAKDNSVGSYETWRQNFGTAAGAGSSVPEPSTVGLLFFVGMAVWRRR